VAAGTDTELVIYPEEEQVVRRLLAMIDLGARASGFLTRHLLGWRLIG
jgi:hypothetical protein